MFSHYNMFHSQDFIQIDSLDSFFQKRIQTLLKYEETTRAYIVNTLSSLKHDYSKDSLTIIYAQAQQQSRFDLYQNIGDWILFIQSVCPAEEKNSEYYNILAQNSYYRCYRILNKEWKVFEELADTFPNLVKDLRIRFIYSSE